MSLFSFKNNTNFTYSDKFSDNSSVVRIYEQEEENIDSNDEPFENEDEIINSVDEGGESGSNSSHDLVDNEDEEHIDKGNTPTKKHVFKHAEKDKYQKNIVYKEDQ